MIVFSALEHQMKWWGRELILVQNFLNFCRCEVVWMLIRTFGFISPNRTMLRTLPVTQLFSWESAAEEDNWTNPTAGYICYLPKPAKVLFGPNFNKQTFSFQPIGNLASGYCEWFSCFVSWTKSVST